MKSHQTLSRGVLLVSAAYEPLGIIGMVRAFLLVWKGSAQMVEVDPDRKIHSQKMEHDVPTVIRLVRYIDIRKRRRESGKQRFRIFVRDNFRCQYCSVKVGHLSQLLEDTKGRPRKMLITDLTLDHILPQSREGVDDPENLATACKPCNSRKGARTPDEARMPLLATPSALRYGLDRALLKHYAESRPEWRPYLFLDAEEKAA